MDTDRNLLFGVLALQADLLDNDRFAEACSAWAARKDTPLADLLVERGWLTPDARSLIDLLLKCFLKRHGGDAHASLAAVAGPEVRRALDTVDDPEVAHSLASLPPAGRYRLLRPHARGGLGEVFVALDTELHRPVALKQMQPRYADDAPKRKRFVLEAEVTGGLEHPGIVPVYGLGCYADGQPFYAMRFIQGDSLQEAVTRFHAAADFRGATFRQLLRRFVDVCNAVAYAHSRGVLHRDLKPANVMLGPFGETLVVDWGLAKLLGRACPDGDGTSGERTLQPASLRAHEETLAGSVLGTPAYMSPEQAAGWLEELGPASDVYSLGATLYTVLTDCAPFDGADPGAVLWQVQRGDFRPPRQVRPAVPPALDAVCRKAMARDPGVRYPTPLALAAEVERWLAGEPVGAYRDPPAVRLLRWGRRHQKLVAAGTALLVTAVLALGASLWAVERERTRTAAAKVQAEENFQLALEAVDRYLNTVTQDPRLKAQDFFALRKALLETAVPFYERFAEAKAGDPQQEAARGRAFHRLAAVRRALGANEAALADYERMRAAFAQLAAGFPTVPEYRQFLARSYNDLGLLLADLGRGSEAEGAIRQSLALLAQLAADFPAEPEYRQELAGSHRNLGTLLEALGRRAEAEAAYRRALDLLKQLAADPPSGPEYRHHLAQSHNNLGNVLKDLGQRPEAEAAYGRARALLEQLTVDFAAVPQYRQELAMCYANLGMLLKDLGRGPEAEAAYRRALDLQKRLTADLPSVPVYRRDLAMCYNALGILLAALGRTSEAEAVYQQALTLQAQLAADFPAVPQYAVDLGAVYCDFAHLLRDRRGPAASLEWYAKAQAVLRPVLDKELVRGTARLFLRNVHWGRAEALDRLGRHAEAAADWEQAIARNDERPSEGWLGLRRALSLARAGQHREATAAVEALLQPGNVASGALYDAACVYALAAAQAARAAPPQTSSLRAEQWASRAVALLRQTVQKGYSNVAHMKKDADLDALRPRPDFRQLLADLEAKAPR
jgi:serine/threonine-protein kinase